MRKHIIVAVAGVFAGAAADVATVGELGAKLPAISDNHIRPLPVARAPFETSGRARVVPELLSWNYKPWAFAPPGVYHTWAEFRAGDRSVLLQGQDRRLVKYAEQGARRGTTAGFGLIGIYSGKGAAQTPGANLLAVIKMRVADEREQVSSTNDTISIDREKNAVTWKRIGKDRAYAYEARAIGPGVVVVEYDIGLVAEFDDSEAVKKGVAIVHEPPQGGRQGRLTIDLGESATMRVASAPLTSGLDFWSEDAYHVPVKPGRNLLMNPGFEQGMKGWTDAALNQRMPYNTIVEKNGGRPLVELSDDAHGGHCSLRVKGVTNGNWICGERLCSAPLPVVPGRMYTLSWWFKGRSDAVMRCWLEEPSATTRLGFKYDKTVCATKCGDPANPTKWVRRAFSFVPTGCGVVVCVSAGNECEFLVDDFQLEEGNEATEPDDDPVVARLRTGDQFNFIEFGRRIGARVALFGRPGLKGHVRMRVHDFYFETLYDREVGIQLDETGAGAFSPDLDSALRGLKGVFFVRYDFAADGKRWTDYERFQICNPVGIKHPSAKFFAEFTEFHERSSMAPEYSRRMRALGWGATTWMRHSLFNAGASGEAWKTNGIVPYLHTVITELSRFDPVRFGWKKENFTHYTNSCPDKIRLIREAAYRCGMECREDDTWWALFNEEELSQKVVQAKDYDTWAIYQKAAYDGLKAAFDKRGLKLHYAPSHGVVGGNAQGIATLKGYIEAGRKIGLEYDFVSVHQGWALDGASIGNWSDRETNHDMLEAMLASVGRPDMPYMQSETFYLVQMRLPSWGAIDWCDAYLGTIPSFALGNHEFLHAGLLARAFIIDLRRFPRLMMSDPWIKNPVLDRDMTPSVWPVVANTLGHLLPDPRFVALEKPFAGVHGYVFKSSPDGADYVMALWQVDKDLEVGAKKGDVLEMDLPDDVKCVDLMGNERKAKDGRIPLTCVPLFFTSRSSEALLKSLRTARCATLKKREDTIEWHRPQEEVKVARCAMNGPDWSIIAPVAGHPQMKAAWNENALHLRFEAEDADSLRISLDGIADARTNKSRGLGPDDSVYDFFGDAIKRVKAVNTQFADGTTTAADDEEVRRDFGRRFTPRGKGGVWEISITPRFLTPTELVEGSRCGFAFAFSRAPIAPEVGDPTEWMILTFVGQ